MKRDKVLASTVCVYDATCKAELIIHRRQPFVLVKFQVRLGVIISPVYRNPFPHVYYAGGGHEMPFCPLLSSSKMGEEIQSDVRAIPFPPWIWGS